MTTFPGKFQLRRGTSALWLASDPVLALGEPGLDTDLGRIKIGDGVKAFSALSWFTPPLFTFPPTAGWSALNSGSVTADVNGRVSTVAASGGGAFQGELRTLTPASNYTATFYFDWGSPGVNSTVLGVCLKNTGAGTLITFGAGYNSGWQLRVDKWTSVTVYGSQYGGAASATLVGASMPNWIRVRDDATTRFYEYSYNGIDWLTPLFSHARTTDVTPDQIGWGISATNSGGSYSAITRLRHFAGVA